MERRISSLLMALLLLAVLLMPSMTVLAASEITASYTPGLSNTSGTPSSEMTFTLSMKLSEACVLNGMQLAIEYDESRLTYKNGTASMKHSAFSDAIIYPNDNGKISVVWTSEEKTKMPKNFEVLSLQFKVDADAAPGATDITVKILDLYSSSVSAGQLNITPLSYAESAKTVFTVTELDTAVKDVINLINAIGAVSYTPESEQKISAAEQAYAALGTAQQKTVSNYGTLTTARTAYNQLKKEALEQAAIETEVMLYQTTHKTAIELNTTTINEAEDKNALLTLVDTALEDYKLLSVQAQSELFTTKNNLQAYKTLLEKLIADAEELAKQEGYQKEAQEYIATFLNAHQYTLTLTPETVKSFDESIVEKAWAEYDAMKELPDVGIYIVEGLEEEALLLQQLKTRLTELKAEENPELSAEILAAENWKDQFSSVLALDPESLVYADVFDIRLAKAILELQDEKVLELLVEETAILETLYEKAMTVEPDETIVEIDHYVEVEKVVEVEKIVEKNNPLGGIFNLGINNRSVGPFIWILLGLALLSTIIFTALRIVWGILIKKGGKANETK